MQTSLSALAPFLFGSLAFALSGASDGDEHAWPQWRGPARDGLSTETDWSSKGRPESAWEKEVGLGYSSVTIQDGRLFTMGYDTEGGMDLVWCLDAKTGEELWVHTYEAEIWNEFHTGGTLSTPSIDGNNVYTLNREGNLYCLDARYGNEEWHVQIHDLAELEVPRWGFSAAPLVLGDMVVINAGRVIAFDKSNGKVKWMTEKSYGHAYSTPTDFDLAGRPALAVFVGLGLVVLELETGKECYTHEWKTKYDVNAASPILVGDDRVFISSGYDHGCAMLRLGEKGAEVLWEKKTMRNEKSGCVVIGDHIYGFDDAIFRCFDLNGEEQWSERGIGNGALTGSPGRLILIGSKGELIVAKATPEGFEPLSREKVMSSDAVFWTKPVLLDGMIYLRSSTGELVCRDHSQKDEGGTGQ